MKQTEEKHHPLLGRKRYTFEFEHQGQATPTKKIVKEEIAKKLNLEASKVAIRHVYTNYGSNISKVIAQVYEDEKILKLLETPKGKKPVAAQAPKK